MVVRLFFPLSFSSALLLLNFQVTMKKITTLMTEKSLYCGDVITMESDKSEFNLSFLYNCGVMPHWRSSMSILFTSLCSS